MLHAQMCLVGSRQFNAFGSHGAADHVSFCHFPTLEECCSHLKDEQGVARDARRSITVRGKSPAKHEPTWSYCSAGCRVVGVEIMDGAEPVQAHPFTGPTALMIGNEVRRCCR